MSILEHSPHNERKEFQDFSISFPESIIICKVRDIKEQPLPMFLVNEEVFSELRQRVKERLRYARRSEKRASEKDRKELENHSCVSREGRPLSMTLNQSSLPRDNKSPAEGDLKRIRGRERRGVRVEGSYRRDVRTKVQRTS